MRIFDNVTRTYKTQENAITALDKALVAQGRQLGDARWTIITHADGRFSPLVIIDRNNDLNLCALANAGVCVTN